MEFSVYVSMEENRTAIENDINNFFKNVINPPINKDSLSSISVKSEIKERDSELIANTIPLLSVDKEYDTFNLKIGDRFFKQNNDGRRLTLLHEFIHMKLMLEATRHRHAGNKADERKRLSNIHKKQDVQNLSNMFFNLYEEFLAELYLKENYTQFFDARIIILERFIMNSKSIEESNGCNDEIKKFVILYEIVRASFILKLSGYKSDSLKNHKGKLGCMLKSLCTEEGKVSFDDWYDKIINVSLNPLSDDAAFEDISKKILEI